MAAVQSLEVKRISCLEAENLSASEKSERYHVHESPSTGDQDHDRQQGWLSSKVEPSLLLIHTKGNGPRVYGLQSAVWNFYKTKKRGMEIGKLIHSFHKYILYFYHILKTEFTEWGSPAASSQQAQVQSMVCSGHLCNSEKVTWGWPARTVSLRSSLGFFSRAKNVLYSLQTQLPSWEWAIDVMPDISARAPTARYGQGLPLLAMP